MNAADTHCHLQLEQFDADREEVIARSLEHLDWIVVVGDGIEGCLGSLALVRPRLYVTVGFHPYHAADYNEEAESRLAGLAARPGVVAIGETGLDYHNEFAPRARQLPCFERQLALAARLGMPAVIHCRAADDDAYAILREYAPRLTACILHCFGGSVQFARQCLDLGCYVSFAGNVTFPKAAVLQEAARLVPADRLLAETDAPYLAPQTVRGKRCEPPHVLHTVQFLAALRGEPVEELSERILQNACRSFRIPV